MELSGDATLNGLGELDVTWADESQSADTANSATDSDKLDGLHGSSYLLGNSTTINADTVDGSHASAFLAVAGTATDSDKVDGSHASAFLAVDGTAADSDKLDGFHGSSYAIGGFRAILGDTVRNSNDTERTSTALSYTKKKEIRLNASLLTMRVSFDLHGTGGATAYGRVYVNGVAVGIVKQTVSTTYVTYLGDFSVGYVNTDLIQVYIYSSASDKAAYVANFRLEYNGGITTLGAYTLAVPLHVTADPTISVTNQDP
jgi:hypothetical protein